MHTRSFKTANTFPTVTPGSRPINKGEEKRKRVAGDGKICVERMRGECCDSRYCEELSNVMCGLRCSATTTDQDK